MGLQIWLPLDGNINNQGLSDVKIHGAPTSWQEGKIGKCAKFNGDYKTIYTETTHEFDYTDNFSWACWVLPVYSGTAQQYIFTVGRADYGSYGYGARLASATQINIKYGSGEWGISCEAFKWIHIAFVKRDKNIRIYKNGSVYESITYGGATPTYTESVGLALGCFRYNVGNRYPSFCSINDFRLYNAPLTDRQVKEISKGLVCHYPLGEIDGKIGGRNILRNSKNLASLSLKDTLAKVERTDTNCKLSLASGVASNSWYAIYTDFTIEKNQSYTASIEIETVNLASESKGCHFTAAKIPPNSSWSDFAKVDFKTPGKYHYTFNSGDNTSVRIALGVQGDGSSNYVIAKNLKLEKGTSATSWTPASEDDASFYDNIIYDTSGYCNNGSVTDSTCPTWSSDTPRYKGSYAFNGNKQYVNCGTSTMIDGQEEITINCWAYMNDWTNFNARLFSCTESGGYNTEGVNNSIRFALNIYITSDKSKYDYTSTIGGYSGIKLSDMASGWHMITCVYKASVGDAIYLDGKLYEKKIYTSYGIHFNKYSYLFLGGESAGVNCIAPYFNGKLSDFRIYATALSDSNILELYQSSASVDNNGNLMLTGEVIEE